MAIETEDDAAFVADMIRQGKLAGDAKEQAFSDIESFKSQAKPPDKPGLKSELAFKSLQKIPPRTQRPLPDSVFNNPLGIAPALSAVDTVASAAVALPVSGVAGMVGGVMGMVPGGESPMDKATRYQRATQQALTRDPANAESEWALESVGRVGEVASDVVSALPSAMASFALEEDFTAAREYESEFGPTQEERMARYRDLQERGPFNAAADATLESTGSPALATGVKILPEAVASVIGVKNPFRKTPKPDPKLPPQVTQGKPTASVGKPTMDAPVDFTPPVPAETIIKNLRKGRADKVADAVMPDAETLNSAQRLNVDLNPEHYSSNAAFQDVARALKTQPGSALQAKEVAALAALSKRADDLVLKNSGSLDKAEFSQVVGEQIGTTVDDLAKQATTAYDKVRASIPAQTKVNTVIIRDYIDNKLADFGGDKSQLSKVEKQLLSLTKINKEGVAIAPTYATLDNIRKNVGEGFNRRSGPFKNGTDANLREVYGVLSDVQGGVARSFGIGDLYDGAKGLVTTRKALEDSAVQLFGRDISGSLVPKLKGAATGLVQGDVSRFNRLIHQLPANRRGEAAATILGDIFAGGSRRGGELSTGFASSYSALNRNKVAKDALFSHLPASAKTRFDDIGRVITGIVDSNRKPMGNPSGTAGGIIKALDDLSLPAKIYDAGKKVAVAESVSSSLAMPGVGAAGVVGSLLSRQRTPVIVAADQMLASPAFARSMNKAIEGDVSTANQIIENSPHFKSWVKTIDQSDAANIAKLGFIAWVTEEQE